MKESSGFDESADWCRGTGYDVLVNHQRYVEPPPDSPVAGRSDTAPGLRAFPQTDLPSCRARTRPELLFAGQSGRLPNRRSVFGWDRGEALAVGGLQVS